MLIWSLVRKGSEWNIRIYIKYLYYSLWPTYDIRILTGARKIQSNLIGDPKHARGPHLWWANICGSELRIWGRQWSAISSIENGGAPWATEPQITFSARPGQSFFERGAMFSNPSRSSRGRRLGKKNSQSKLLCSQIPFVSHSGYAADEITHCIRPQDIKERRAVIILRKWVAGYLFEGKAIFLFVSFTGFRCHLGVSAADADVVHASSVLLLLRCCLLKHLFNEGACFSVLSVDMNHWTMSSWGWGEAKKGPSSPTQMSCLIFLRTCNWGGWNHARSALLQPWQL